MDKIGQISVGELALQSLPGRRPRNLGEKGLGLGRLCACVYIYIYMDIYIYIYEYIYIYILLFILAICDMILAIQYIE